MKSNVKLGQIQLLIPLLIIITSTIVFAANTTISTSNLTITEERGFTIEVWANTSIALSLEGNLVKAILILDNGTLLENQQLDFYLNNSLVNSILTDSDGYAELLISESGSYVLRTVFSGDPSLFLNPSESILELEIKNETKIKITENITL